MIELIQRAQNFDKGLAVISEDKEYTYADLLLSSERIAAHLLNGKSDLQEARIAFIISPGFDYVAVQWGIWRAGGIAVPLCVKHPVASLKYTIEDSQSSVIIAGSEFEEILKPLAKDKKLPLLIVDQFKESASSSNLPNVTEDRRALIIYTSGTTGNPKGVVTTHQNIKAQIATLVEAWKWDKQDHILNVLPLHHVHGLINAMCCPLWSGACCEFAPFDPGKMMELFLKGRINIFMAVPTIYYKLIAYWEELNSSQQQELRNTFSKFRLMVSGSAALPVSVMEKWKTISGHSLLERYGMTEIGMAIGNPYDGERRAGHIGQPFPGVEVQLVDDQLNLVKEGEAGQILIKGPSVFKEYWNRKEATNEAFTKNGWFLTGDVAVLEDGYYRIMGRNSVDIIKSGGYKISALEIEEVVRTHPKILDCAVVGLPDEEWSEIIGASLIAKEKLDTGELNSWLKERLPAYKIPRKYIFQDDFPRNAMGKVTKNELKNYFK